jgi:hypothetical protein
MLVKAAGQLSMNVANRTRLASSRLEIPSTCLCSFLLLRDTKIWNCIFHVVVFINSL